MHNLTSFKLGDCTWEVGGVYTMKPGPGCREYFCYSTTIEAPLGLTDKTPPILVYRIQSLEGDHKIYESFHGFLIEALVGDHNVEISFAKTQAYGFESFYRVE